MSLAPTSWSSARTWTPPDGAMDTIEEVDREEASGPFFPMRTAGSYTTGESYFDRDGAGGSQSRRVNGVGGGGGGGGGNDEEEDSSGGSVGMVVGCPTDDSTMRLKAVSARLSQLMIMGNGSNGGGVGGVGGGSTGSLASSRLQQLMQLDGDRGGDGMDGAEEGERERVGGMVGTRDGPYGENDEEAQEEEGGSRDALLVPQQASSSRRAQTAGGLAGAGSCPQ